MDTFYTLQIDYDPDYDVGPQPRELYRTIARAQLEAQEYANTYVTFVKSSNPDANVEIRVVDDGDREIWVDGKFVVEYNIYPMTVVD